MNPWLWLVIWLVVMVAPVSLKWLKRKLRYLLIAVAGLVAGLIAIFSCTIDTYMVWWILVAKGVATVVEWICISEEYKEEEEYYYYPGRTRFKSATMRRIFKYLTIFGIIGVVLGSILLAWQVTMARGVNNAVTFDQMITYMPAGTPLFQNEIPDNMLRLTTDELARNIVLRNIAHFGSDVQILSNHITVYQGRLVWIATVGSTNLWADNKIRGMIIVDANNPEIEPVIINESIYVGEGLIYFPPFHYAGIQGNAYYGISTANAYGRAYLTPDETGEWKYILTTTTVDQWSFVSRPNGVYVYNKQGIMEKHYDMDDIPEWITQRYDEDWLEFMIGSWGAFKRGGGFDIWAGGFPLFIAPSNDRVEITDDTRFIIDPDSNDIVALVDVNLVSTSETLAGVFKACRDGIRYYDLRQYNIMSGHQAENVVESHILKPTAGEYQAQMPLLYTINSTYAWFVPIYWRGTRGDTSSEHETIRLAGLGIVEANDVDHIVIVMTSEGYKGAELVAEAKRRFLGGAFAKPKEEQELSGILERKFSYTLHGNTVYVLTINGTDCVVYTERFDFELVSQIDQLQVGETVSVLVNEKMEFLGFPEQPPS